MRRLRSSVLTLLAVAALTVPLATPASATTYSSANDSITGLPALGTSYIRTGDIVAMWQNVLYTDVQLDQCLSQNSAAAIDGYFGNNTRAATVRWQAENGLGADGIVGARTWSKVWSKTQYLGYDQPHDEYSWAYLGKRLGSGAHFLSFNRVMGNPQTAAFTNRWMFGNLANPSGPGNLIQWTTRTIRTC